MTYPTVIEIREFLEGYGINQSVLTDSWIEKRRDNFVIPYCERITRSSFSSVASVIEYHSGNGKNYLILDRRPVVSITEIRYVLGGNTFNILNLAMIELVQNEGIIKAKVNYDEAFFLPLFAKGDYNIKVTYTYGYAAIPDVLKEAVIYLVCEQALGFIGSRTGGGSVSVQQFNRNFGQRGKYQDERNDLARQAHAILSNYTTRVIGN